ncbi:M48 family metallopeptidase [Myxococcota bacterium]|nr:M48 family metallopeptidase [Myxococcota bacterium]
MHLRFVLAALALVLFLVMYVGLVLLFGAVPARLIVATWGGYQLVVAVVVSTPPVLVILFLLKGLWHREVPAYPLASPVSRESEPALYALVDRVAAEVGAPPPQTIVLIPNVNAAAVGPTSLWGLFWPSSKTLALGLGLVNVLNRSELKAVIAHELGHFSQRGQRLSAWVYRADRLIGSVVNHRDWVDSFLDGFGRLNWRIAWVAWLFQLLFWSVRTLLGGAFDLVIRLERSVRRAHELRADRIAVASTGSDAPVMALWRLMHADEAMSDTIRLLSAELGKQNAITDLYTMQSICMEKNLAVRGVAPLAPLPPGGDATRRLFDPGVAQAPQMWSTHPPNHERELSAKTPYVYAPLDEASAWSFFADPTRTRREMSERVIAQLAPEGVTLNPLSDEETAAVARREYEALALHPKYRGMYLGQVVTTIDAPPERLFGAPPAGEDELRLALNALYPPSLSEVLRLTRALSSELVQLKALQTEAMEAPGGEIRLRGETLRRGDLPRVIEETEARRAQLVEEGSRHERAVRAAHRAAARALGSGWEDYHTGLVTLLHYVECAQVTLQCRLRQAAEVVGALPPGAALNEDQRLCLLGVYSDLYSALSEIWTCIPKVRLGDSLTSRLKIARYAELMDERLLLTDPLDEAPRDDWFPAAVTWVRSASAALATVRFVTLETLLEVEDKLARAALGGESLGEAPEPPGAPTAGADFTLWHSGLLEPVRAPLTLRQRLILSDSPWAAIGRVLAAGFVLTPTLAFGLTFGEAAIVAKNGLGVPVVVQIAGEELTLVPGAHQRLNLPMADGVEVVTRTHDGQLVEQFVVDLTKIWTPYVYNVAGADLLVIRYWGTGVRLPEPEVVGARRWSLSRALYIFDEPPQRRTRSQERDGPHAQLTLFPHKEPARQAKYTPPDERLGMVTAHLRWDPVDDPLLAGWALTTGAPIDAVWDALRARPESERRQVELATLMQRVSQERACVEHQEWLRAAPNDADLAFINVGCLPDQDRLGALRALNERHPEHNWTRLELAQAEAAAGGWEAAAELLRGLSQPSGQIALDAELLRLRVNRRLGVSGDDARTLRLGPSIWQLLIDAEAGIHLTKSSEGMALRALVAGDLPRAESELLRMSEPDPLSFWLIAASDGVSDTTKKRAFSTPVNSESVWVGLAVLSVLGAPRDAAELLAAQTDAALFDRLRPVLDAPVADLERLVDERLVGATAHHRGVVLMVGTLRMGAATPQRWRDEARALLLPWERPPL